MSDEKAAAPAKDVADKSVPPTTKAGAAKEPEPEGTGVPAGQPILEPEEGAKSIPNAVRLKVAPPHEALEVLGAEAVQEYRDFTPSQAAALVDAAFAQSVILIDESEEASGEAST
jgi:hypothetical protein